MNLNSAGFYIKNLSKDTIQLPGSARIRISKGCTAGPMLAVQFDVGAVQTNPHLLLTEVLEESTAELVPQEAPVIQEPSLPPTLLAGPPSEEKVESQLDLVELNSPKNLDPLPAKKRGRPRKNQALTGEEVNTNG